MDKLEFGIYVFPGILKIFFSHSFKYVEEIFHGLFCTATLTKKAEGELLLRVNRKPSLFVTFDVCFCNSLFH